MTRVPYDRREDASGLRLVGHTDLNGRGDCMHIARKGDYAYVAHMGDSRIATSIVDVSDPASPRVVRQIPAREGSRSHKVQIVGDLMLINHERDSKLGASRWTGGLAIHDVSNPVEPKQIGFLPVGGNGVHRMTFWELPFAYVTGGEEGFKGDFLMIVDLSDPTRPKEIGRWWFPGQWVAGGEARAWSGDRLVKLHHATMVGDRAYGGWWDMGLVILDISDRTKPTLVGHLDFGAAVSGNTHSARLLPGTSVVAVTDECNVPDCREPFPKVARLVDVSDEANPRLISQLPIPEGDFCSRGGRFGAHNLHEMEPGSLIDPTALYVTYFNAGLRVFDVRDPKGPREIAHYIPESPPGQKAPQINGVYVHQDGLIYVTDRFSGGLYILERV